MGTLHACAEFELLVACSAVSAVCLWTVGSPLLSPPGNEAFPIFPRALGRIRGCVDTPNGIRLPGW